MNITVVDPPGLPSGTYDENMMDNFALSDRGLKKIVEKYIAVSNISKFYYNQQSRRK